MKRFLPTIIGVITILLGGFYIANAAGCTPFLVASGGTGKCTFTASQLLYGNGTNALSSVATTTVTAGTGVSFNSFTVIGNSPVTITASGGNSFDYPFPNNATTTLLGFYGGASTTILTANSALFGGTATSSFSTAGVLTLTGIAGTQCLHSISGVVSGTGSDCGSGGGSSFSYPFTPTSNFGATSQATTGIAWFQNGFQASSTSYIASTTFAINGNVGIGSSTPWGILSINVPTYNATTPMFVIGSTTATGVSNPFLINGNGNAYFGTSTTGTTNALTVQNTNTNTNIFNMYNAAGTAVLTLSNGGSLNAPNGGITTAAVLQGVGVQSNSNGTAASAAFRISNAGNEGMFAPDSRTLAFSQNGVQALTITGSQGVGIGTTTPYAQFAIATQPGASGASTTLFMIASSTAGTATSTLFSISNTGSTTIGNFGPCSGSNALTTNSSGTIVCGAITGTGGSSFGYPFALAGNATSTLTQFNGGLTAYSTSTIGDSTQGGGLTISGGATTTGTAYFAGKVGIGTTTQLARFAIHANPSDAYTPTLLEIASSSLVGTTTVLRILNSGPILALNGTAAAPTYAFSSRTDTGIFNRSTGATITFSVSNTARAEMAAVFQLKSDFPLAWSSGLINAGNDVDLSRISTNVLGVGNGPQGNTSGTLVGERIGLGTTSPYAQLSVFATSTTGLGAPTTLFAIASTTGGTVTSTLFSVSNTGAISVTGTLPATSTNMIFDWNVAPPLTEYQVGTAGFTITLINATTSFAYGSTRKIGLCNPGAVAGAATIVGVEGISNYTQTTTANQCDYIGIMVVHATSTSAFKAIFTGSQLGVQ